MSLLLVTLLKKPEPKTKATVKPKPVVEVQEVTNTTMELADDDAPEGQTPPAPTDLQTARAQKAVRKAVRAGRSLGEQVADWQAERAKSS